MAWETPRSLRRGWEAAARALALAAGAPAAGQTCYGPQPDLEPNGTMATATPLTLPIPQSQHMHGHVPGSLSPAGDEDWFRVTLEAGDLLWLLVDTAFHHLPGQTYDSVVEVFDGGGNLLEADDDDGTALSGQLVVTGQNSTIAGLPVPATGDYFIRVRAWNPADTMSYLLVLARTRPPFTLEREPNNSPSQALPIDFARTVEATIDEFDDDFYEVGLLDFGWPVVMAGGTGASALDLVFEVDPFTGPTFPMNSSGAESRAAEAVRLPTWAMFRVTANMSGSQPAPYRLGLFWSGDTCPLPVQLQSFEVR